MTLDSPLDPDEEYDEEIDEDDSIFDEEIQRSIRKDEKGNHVIRTTDGEPKRKSKPFLIITSAEKSPGIHRKTILFCSKCKERKVDYFPFLENFGKLKTSRQSFVTK